MGYTFDGPNKLIVLTTTDPVSAVDMYSRWKDWVMAGNCQYELAFNSVAGDPIGPGQVIAPYIFLNTTAGWKIRPSENDHELRISGNLYSIDPATSMFVSTVDPHNVTVVIERSAAAIGMSVEGGGGGATAGEIADAVLDESLTLHVGSNTVGQALSRLDTTVSSRATAVSAANAVWEAIEGIRDNGTMGAALVLLRKMATNKLVESPGDPGTVTLYDNDGVTPIATWSLTDYDGGAVTGVAGSPSIRIPA